MRRITQIITLASFLFATVSCSGKKETTAVEKEINPIWGMWAQNDPIPSSKIELMLNEDMTGFVFNDDTLLCELRWQQDKNLKVQYLVRHDTVQQVIEHQYEYAIVDDTLMLNEISGHLAPSTSVRYKRVTE